MRDALLVNPADTEEVAEALGIALEMSLHERRIRWRRMMDVLALKLGLTTAAESEQFFRQIEEAAGQRYHAVLWPLLLGAWKRKPS